MKNRSHQAELLFEEALQLPLSDRKDWIVQKCGVDSELFEEVCTLFELQLESSDLFAEHADTSQQGEAGFDSTVQQDALQMGSEVGDFIIEARVGEGGMGIVYRARQRALNRTVALKVLRPHACQTPSHRRRFQVEMEAAARLQHPHIVGVHTTGSSGELLYYAMEFVDGQSLADVIKNLRSMPVEELSDCPTTLQFKGEQVSQLSSTLLVGQSDAMPPALQAGSRPDPPTISENSANYFDWIAGHIADVAKAVHFAHTNQVLHRDLKPSNLLLTQSGTVRVGDFGLARDLSEPGITQTGEVIGTPYYMAPEQIRVGEAVGHSVDIYAVGATLYELLTLQPPFPGESRDQVLARIVREDLVAPRSINPRIPRDLETICLKCLEKEATDRYPSAEELEADLGRFLRREPIQAKRASAVDRAVKWIDRHRALAASIAALPVCIAIVATVFAFRNHRLAQALQLETIRANTSFFDAKVEQARAVMGTTRPTRRSESLQSIQAAIEVLPRLELSQTKYEQKRCVLREQVVSALAVAELSVGKRWTVESPWISEVEFASDYQTYAQPSREGNIRVRNIADESRERILTGPKPWPARQMKFSKDGRFLASKHYVRGAADQAELYVWDLGSDSKTPALELSNRFVFLFDFDFATTRNELVSVNPHGEVEIYSLQSMQLVRTIPREFPSSAILAYSSNDELVIAPYRGNRLEVWEAGASVRMTDEIEISRNISAISWKDNQRKIAVGTTNGEVQIWEVGRFDKSPKILLPHKNEIISVKFQPKGTLLAARTLSQQASITDTASLRSHPLNQNAEDIHIMESGFSRDGRQLGYRLAREFGLYEVGDAVWSILSSDENPKPVQEIRFHPQHSRLLARTIASGIELWDTSQNSLLDTIPMDRHMRLRFSPDGASLYAGALGEGVSRWPISVRVEQSQLLVEVGQRKVLYGGSCRSLDVSPTGKFVVCLLASRANAERRVTLLDAESGEIVFQTDLEAKVGFVEFTENEQLLLTATVEAQKVHVWDLATGTKVREDPIAIPSGYIDYSRERKLFAQGLQTEVNFQPFGDRIPTHHMPLDRRRDRRVRFSRDGRLAVTSSANSQKLLIDTIRGHVLTSLNATIQEESVDYDFSPDGEQLAVAGLQDIHIWHLGELKQELQKLGLGWEETPE